MSLPEAITGALPPDDNLRVGVVATASPLIVTIQGASISMGHLASYTPVVGHVVAVFRQDSAWLCLGRIV